MAAIGSLVFCTDCGNLLPASKGIADTDLVCDCCHKVNKEPVSKTTTTRTKPSDFPSLLRQKLQSSVQTVDKNNITTEARIQEKCPECGREEVKFQQVQQRGADEGSANIYNCECGHRWTENN